MKRLLSEKMRAKIVRGGDVCLKSDWGFVVSIVGSCDKVELKIVLFFCLSMICSENNGKFPRSLAKALATVPADWNQERRHIW
jgi:hypothetical protein